MNSTQLKQLDGQHVAQTYARFDLALAKGKGCEVWDTDGNHYLDFTSGIGTNALGWGDEQWVAAVAEQAATLAHTSNLYYTAPYIQLAEKLVRASGLKKAFFCNSGAEANEGAIKTARKYSHDKYGKDRATVLSLVNSFHGRTISTLAATGQDVFHQHFFPFTQGFEHIEANDFAALKARVAQGDVCAVLVELIQGEGGVLPLNLDYVQQVQALCRAHDLLLMVDEVQTGVGRTGTLFAFEQFGVQPDVVTLAKGLGGGLPIGAILLGEKVESTLGKSDHASTFGGNPVSCAAANVVIDRLTPEFLNEVKRKGELLRSGLLALPKVKSVAGMGLMLGVEFEDGIVAGEIVKAAMQKGILTLTAKHKLRLLPPLIISDAEIAHGLSVLREVLSA